VASLSGTAPLGCTVVASLDFAFLAESARVDAGNTLSGLGIGFTHAYVARLPMAINVTVAGLAWMTEEDQGSTQLSLTLVGAEETYEASLDATLTVHPVERPLEGRFAATFDIPVTVAVPVAGIYRVTIRLDGTIAKTLAFEVLKDEGAGQ